MTPKIIKIMFVILLILFELPFSVLCEEGKVDYTYEKYFNLTETKEVKARLILEGTNWVEPVLMKFQIIDSEMVMYSYESDFLFPEPEYFDADYFDSCSEFVECKKKYYSNLLDDIVVSTSKYRHVKDYQTQLLSEVLESKLNENQHKYIEPFINYLLLSDYYQLFIPESVYKNWAILVFNRELDAFINVNTE